MAQDPVAGKYELIREIGRGGMGAVWEARHISLGRRVAMKFIDGDLATNADALQRFDNEARAAAALDSRYVTQVFDHGVTEDGRPFIVMELLVGESLASRASRATLTLSEVSRIVRHVARGLGNAHERGIIHRDLKLENVFLARGEEDIIAKVLDFGVAKVLRPLDVDGDATTTRSGTILGTPYYMSPEQARGQAIDHRTDLWSLGVVAYRCVTGRFPFEGSSIGDLLVKICVEPIPAPSSVDPSLPAAFDAWMARALSRDSLNRFGSAREMADALDALADSAPASVPLSFQTIGCAKTLPSFPPVYAPTPLETHAASPKPSSRSRAAIAFALVACAAGFAIGSFRIAHHATTAAAVVSAPLETHIAETVPSTIAPTPPQADAGSPSTTTSARPATKRAAHTDIELTR